MPSLSSSTCTTGTGPSLSGGACTECSNSSTTTTTVGTLNVVSAIGYANQYVSDTTLSPTPSTNIYTSNLNGFVLVTKTITDPDSPTELVTYAALKCTKAGTYTIMFTCTYKDPDNEGAAIILTIQSNDYFATGTGDPSTELYEKRLTGTDNEVLTHGVITTLSTGNCIAIYMEVVGGGSSSNRYGFTGGVLTITSGSVPGTLSSIGLAVRNFDTNTVTQTNVIADSLTFQGDTIFTQPSTATLKTISDVFYGTGTTVATDPSYSMNTKGTINVTTNIDSSDGNYYTNKLTTNTIQVTGTTKNSLFNNTIQMQPTSGKVVVGKSTDVSSYDSNTLSVEKATFFSGQMSVDNSTFTIQKTGGNQNVMVVPCFNTAFTNTNVACSAIRLGVNTSTNNSGYYGFFYNNDQSGYNGITMYVDSAKSIRFYNNLCNTGYGPLTAGGTSSFSYVNKGASAGNGIMHLQVGSGTTGNQIQYTGISMNFTGINGLLFDTRGPLDSQTNTSTLTNAILNMEYNKTTGIFTYKGTNPLYIRVQANTYFNGNAGNFIAVTTKWRTSSSTSAWEHYYGTNGWSIGSIGRTGICIDTIFKVSNGNQFAIGIQTAGQTYSAIDSNMERTQITITNI